MSKVFADTWYWVALIDPNNQHHRVARAVDERIRGSQVITTLAVLLEALNFFKRGPGLRAHAVEETLSDPGLPLLPFQARDLEASASLYRRRLDKGYSLTDCHSMLVMRERGIPAVLSSDHHFRQEGFELLLPLPGYAQ